MNEKCLTLIACPAALWKDSDIAVGCMPLSRSFSAASKNAPAITTTVVVPSPASTS